MPPPSNTARGDGTKTLAVIFSLRIRNPRPGKYRGGFVSVTDATKVPPQGFGRLGEKTKARVRVLGVPDSVVWRLPTGLFTVSNEYADLDSPLVWDLRFGVDLVLLTAAIGVTAFNRAFAPDEAVEPRDVPTLAWAVVRPLIRDHWANLPASDAAIRDHQEPEGRGFPSGVSRG